MTRIGTMSEAGSDLERRLIWQIAALRLPIPEREYRFHPIRHWRFDLAWPDRQLAVEIEGGTFSGALHTRLHHGTAACLLCRAVWAALEADPRIRAALDQGLDDLAAGRRIPWDEP